LVVKRAKRVERKVQRSEDWEERERERESRNKRSELNRLIYCRKERKRYTNLHGKRTCTFILFSTHL